MTNSDEIAVLRVSDADRNGTLRRLHNAVALGLIDMDEFSERSALVALALLSVSLFYRRAVAFIRYGGVCHGGWHGGVSRALGRIVSIVVWGIFSIIGSKAMGKTLRQNGIALGFALCRSSGSMAWHGKAGK